MSAAGHSQAPRPCGCQGNGRHLETCALATRPTWDLPPCKCGQQRLSVLARGDDGLCIVCRARATHIAKTRGPLWEPYAKLKARVRDAADALAEQIESLPRHACAPEDLARADEIARALEETLARLKVRP